MNEIDALKEFGTSDKFKAMEVGFVDAKMSKYIVDFYIKDKNYSACFLGFYTTKECLLSLLGKLIIIYCKFTSNLTLTATLTSGLPDAD
jgi:hypothetical protein